MAQQQHKQQQQQQQIFNQNNVFNSNSVSTPSTFSNPGTPYSAAMTMNPVTPTSVTSFGQNLLQQPALHHQQQQHQHHHQQSMGSTSNSSQSPHQMGNLPPITSVMSENINPTSLQNGMLSNNITGLLPSVSTYITSLSSSARRQSSIQMIEKIAQLPIPEFSSYTLTRLETHLVNIFFTTVHNRFFPIFYEPHFYSRFYPVNKHPDFLIHSICGFAASFSVHPDLDTSESGREALIVEYLNKARLELEGYRRTTLVYQHSPTEMAQALLVLSRAWFGLDNPPVALESLRMITLFFYYPSQIFDLY
jgi:hypothetical protein